MTNYYISFFILIILTCSADKADKFVVRGCRKGILRHPLKMNAFDNNYRNEPIAPSISILFTGY